MLTEMLARLLERNGIPVESILIGDQMDRATWVVRYPPGTSSDLQTAGNALVAAFTPDSAASRDEQKQAVATRLGDDRALRAVARVCWEELQKCQPQAGQTLLTFPQFRSRVVTVLQGLM